MIKLSLYSAVAGATIIYTIEGAGYLVMRGLLLFFLVKVLIEAAKDRIARRHAR